MPPAKPGPSPFSLGSSFSSLLGLCSTTRVLRQVHARFVLHGLHQNSSLSSGLVACYAGLGRLDLSMRVFDSCVGSSRDVSLYNSIIRAVAAAHGEPWRALLFYRQMLGESLLPDEDAYASLIKSSWSDPCFLETGKMVHSHVVKLGLDSSVNVSAAIAELYGKHGESDSTGCPVESGSVRSMAYWNRLICSTSQDGDLMESFRVFGRMRLEGFKPDSKTLVSLLRACVNLECLRVGNYLHLLAIVNGFGGDLLVSTALLTMYCKLGSLEMARLLFDYMPKKDSVVWNTMISGYSRNGHAKLALYLLVEMGKEGIRTDLFTAIASLSSAAILRLLQVGKQIHGHVVRNGSDSQVSVHNALIDMYSKCQSLDAARKVFDTVLNKTIVSWSSMIKGYQNNYCHFDALFLYDRMRLDGMRPDSITVINILPACVHVAALQRVQNIHSYVIKQGLNSTISLVTALLVTYSKCGCIKMARKLFDEEGGDRKDIISWNSMIGAYSKYGDWYQCCELYTKMKNSNMKPDKLTFLGLLTASVNSGLVKEGRHCFQQMVEIYGYQPEKEHYACMVDLLGRSGHLDEAVDLIKSMPFEPDAQVWGPLLSACKLHSDTRLAEFAAAKLIDMEPRNPGNFILLSNIYACAGKWDDVAKMRGSLKVGGLKKTPGYSWLEINGHVHEFRVADVSHEKSKDIYTLLRILNQETKIDDDTYLDFF